jgi:hypothetical protein
MVVVVQQTQGRRQSLSALGLWHFDHYAIKFQKKKKEGPSNPNGLTAGLSRAE